MALEFLLCDSTGKGDLPFAADFSPSRKYIHYILMFVKTGIQAA